jgi:hypothetical protein
MQMYDASTVLLLLSVAAAVGLVLGFFMGTVR